MFKRRNKKELEESIKFYLPNEIPEIEIFEYDLQKKAALALALASLEINRCATLFFGISGSGKSDFPFWLVNALNQNFGTKFSMMYAECDKLSNPLMKISDIIEELERKLEEATKNPPSVLVFDEIDSATESIPGSEQHASRLTRWTRYFAKNVPKGFFAIGTTNYPNEVDFTFLRSVRANLFFELTPKKVICKILEKVLKRKDCQKICNKIYGELENDGFAPLASDVVKACEMLKIRENKVENLRFGIVCEDLIALIPGIHKSKVDKYVKTHEDLIKQAQKQMVFWAAEFDKRKLPAK